MAKFDAAAAVDPLEYDFTKYKAGKGEIPEPTTGLVNDFFVGMRQVLREGRALTGDTQDLNYESMTGEELAEAFDALDEKTAAATEFQAKTLALLSDLCQGSPSKDALAKLPLRVLREFNKWLLGELNPKTSEEKATVTQMPTPQDRRPATKGSRKARG